MKKKSLLLLCAVVSSFVMSCSLHVPISEAALFSSKLNETKDFSSIIKASQNRVSITKFFYSKDLVNKYLTSYKNISDSSLNPLWQLSISGFNFLLQPYERLTIGIAPNLFINAGLDLNYNLGYGFHITGAANILLSGEVIFQKKLFSSNFIQGSLGLSYMNEKQEFRKLSFDNPPGKKYQWECTEFDI